MIRPTDDLPSEKEDRKVETFTKHMTLEEIADNDKEMAKDAIKNARRVMFYNPNIAKNYMMNCLRVAVERLGIPNAHKMKGKMLDRVQKAKGIRVEMRDHYKSEESWRNGIYVFQRDELTAFVSVVFEVKHSPLYIKPGPDKYYVVTNVPMGNV